MAAPPDAAVESLLLRRQAELSAARAELDGLVSVYRDTRRRRGVGEIIEIITDLGALQDRVKQVLRNAQREYLSFAKPPFALSAETDDSVAELTHDPTLRSRTIYDEETIGRPGIVEVLRRFREPGEEYRIHANLPIKLTIIDRETAFLPLGPDGSEPRLAAVVVHRSGLLDALLALFERYWAISTPMHIGSHEEPGDRDTPQHLDRDILTLLLAGLTDVGIARQLELSVRTVQRRVHAMMAVAGVRTRLQLGWHAARQQWV